MNDSYNILQCVHESIIGKYKQFKVLKNYKKSFSKLFRKILRLRKQNLLISRTNLYRRRYAVHLLLDNDNHFPWLVSIRNSRHCFVLLRRFNQLDKTFSKEQMFISYKVKEEDRYVTIKIQDEKRQQRK